MNLCLFCMRVCVRVYIYIYACTTLVLRPSWVLEKMGVKIYIYIFKK